MFKPFIGACNNCTRTETWIVIKKGLCQYCNHEKKQKQKCSKAVSENESINRKFHNGTSQSIHIPSKQKGSKIQSIRKGTGEAAVFKKIAEENEPKCFVCGRYIGELTASNFAHILPKALNKYPLFKLNQNNIKLFCHDSYSSCHHRFDKEPRSTLKEPMWHKVFALEEELKQEYKLLKQKP